LKGARGFGDESTPAKSRGKTPVEGLEKSTPEDEAFCLNRYKILSVHGGKFNELDLTHSDSITLCQL